MRDLLFEAHHLGGVIRAGTLVLAIAIAARVPMLLAKLLEPPSMRGTKSGFGARYRRLEIGTSRGYEGGPHRIEIAPCRRELRGRACDERVCSCACFRELGNARVCSCPRLLLHRE